MRSDDLMFHPLIKWFLIGLSIVWALIMITLACVFLKYRNLKTRYSRLGEEPTNDSPSGGEIEMQTR